MRGYSGDEYVATAARREGSRREVMIRHRHWRESESEPDGAAATPMGGQQARRVPALRGDEYVAAAGW